MNSVMRKPRKDADGPSLFLPLPVYAVALILGLGGMLAGCSDPGPAQEAGETVEEMDEDLRGWIEDLREDEDEVQEGESGPAGHDDEFSEEDPPRDMD
ncbi:hypothetical protein [Thioalkalivibrio sp. ALMg11]|uniref:hypothetical protein n=1 Tax=Thioalkalivibrio sp. ALMg11 TaxID=1158165 RepID=UPI00047560BE|nr:hypothetical protein [Thioalkalivibrio sp. ALMg11]